MTLIGLFMQNTNNTSATHKVFEINQRTCFCCIWLSSDFDSRRPSPSRSSGQGGRGEFNKIFCLSLFTSKFCFVSLTDYWLISRWLLKFLEIYSFAPGQKACPSFLPQRHWRDRLLSPPSHQKNTLKLRAQRRMEIVLRRTRNRQRKKPGVQKAQIF